MTSRADVVVCGAGVGGLTLAVALGRQGLRVLVLDKQPREVEVFKGELLQPRSLEILDELGALTGLQASGGVCARFLDCRSADGELIGSLDYGALGGGFNHVMLHYYNGIRAALLAVAGDAVEIGYATRVTGLLRDDTGRVEGVRAQSRGAAVAIRAPLVVGADGRTSFVRREAGIAAKSEQYPHQLVAFDLPDERSLDPRVAAYLTPRGLRALYPLPGGRARLYVQIRTGEFGRILRDGPREWIATVLAATPGLAPIGDALVEGADGSQVMSAWRGHALAVARPGLVLVGDAAQWVHPAAGQGMNTAIADAWLFGEAIEGAVAARGGRLDGVAAEAAGREYEERRRAHVEYLLRLSHNLATLFTATSPLKRAIARRVLEHNRANRRLQYVLTYNMSGYGVHRFTRRDRLQQFGILREPPAATRGPRKVDRIGRGR